MENHHLAATENALVVNFTRNTMEDDELLSMQDRDYISNLIEVVEELKHRLLKACALVDHCAGDELLEEKALLRNLVMQLDGLKLRLRKSQMH